MIKNKDQTNGLEWMLQSAQVDDTDLAEALRLEYYQDLYGYAFGLTGEVPRASELVSAAIREATVNRHRLFPEAGLRAWLYAYLYAAWRGDAPVSRSWGQTVRARLKRLLRWQSDAGLEKPPDHPWQRVGEREIAALALLHAAGCTEAETAYVLQIDLWKTKPLLIRAHRAYYRAFYLASEAGEDDHPDMIDLIHSQADGQLKPADLKRLEQHLQDCPNCRLYRERLPELKKRVQLEFGARSQPEEYPAPEIVPNQTRPAKFRRLSRWPWKEAALVSVVLAALVAFGWSQRLFEPFHTRPMPPRATTIPTSRPGSEDVHAESGFSGWTFNRLELPGDEDRDYFYYQRHVVPGETLESLVDWSGLTSGQIRSINGLTQTDPYLENGTVILAALRESGWFDPMPHPVRDPGPPLTENSTPDEVLARVRRAYSAVDTVWMDFVYAQYGTPGFIAQPSEFSRAQIWAQGDRNKLVVGSWGLIYQFSLSVTGEKAFFNPSAFVGVQESGLVFGMPVQKSGVRSYFLDLVLEELLRITPQSTLQIAGMGREAGREAVALDLLDDSNRRTARFWIDAQTGLVIGLLDYGRTIEWQESSWDFLGMLSTNRTPSEVILNEIKLNAIAIDVSFPEHVFYPPLSPVRTMTWKFTGETLEESEEVLALDTGLLVGNIRIDSYQPPPEDFDVSRAPLIFQYDSPEDPTQDAEEQTRMEVFADGYYLGDLNIPGMRVTHCRRSPDGWRAILSGHSFIDTYFSALYLLELPRLEISPIDVSENHYPSYAFSPDGKSLAYVSCSQGCWIYIQDLETAETERVDGKSTISRIAWSPDGTQFAYVYPTNNTSRLVVKEVNTWETVFEGDYDELNNQHLTPGSPTEKWDRPFSPDSWSNDCYDWP
jgi:hypothetical protein